MHITWVDFSNLAKNVVHRYSKDDCEECGSRSLFMAKSMFVEKYYNDQQQLNSATILSKALTKDAHQSRSRAFSPSPANKYGISYIIIFDVQNT